MQEPHLGTAYLVGMVSTLFGNTRLASMPTSHTCNSACQLSMPHDQSLQQPLDADSRHHIPWSGSLLVLPQTLSPCMELFQQVVLLVIADPSGG